MLDENGKQILDSFWVEQHFWVGRPRKGVLRLYRGKEAIADSDMDESWASCGGAYVIMNDSAQRAFEGY